MNERKREKELERGNKKISNPVIYLIVPHI